MFEKLVRLVKLLLVGPEPEAPTVERIESFERYEDERGCYGQYPSPMEVFEWDVEWHAKMMRLPVPTLLRWRLAVMKRPFSKRTKFLLPRKAGRRLMPYIPLS